MVWNIPGDAPITAPIARDLDQRPMREQLADLGLAPRIRLDIPITSAQTLRVASEILLSLSNSLAVLSRKTDIAEKFALSQAAWDIKAANRKMQALQPKKKYTTGS